MCTVDVHALCVCMPNRPLASTCYCEPALKKVLVCGLYASGQVRGTARAKEVALRYSPVQWGRQRRLETRDGEFFGALKPVDK